MQRLLLFVFISALMRQKYQRASSLCRLFNASYDGVNLNLQITPWGIQEHQILIIRSLVDEALERGMAKNATDSCACRFNSSFSPLYLFFILHLPWLLFSIMSTSSVTPPAGLRQFSDAEIRSNSSRTEDIRSSSGLSSRNEIIMNITPNMFDHASSKMLKASLSSQTPAHSQKHRMAKAFSDQSPTTSGQRDILQVSDLVVAIPTTHTRLIMILASRNWRKGLRTFITNDKQEQVSKLNRSPSAAAHNESYGFFPEDGGELMKYKRRAHYAGDPRQAMTPFMAHRWSWLCDSVVQTHVVEGMLFAERDFWASRVCETSSKTSPGIKTHAFASYWI